MIWSKLFCRKPKRSEASAGTLTLDIETKFDPQLLTDLRDLLNEIADAADRASVAVAAIRAPKTD